MYSKSSAEQRPAGEEGSAIHVERKHSSLVGGFVYQVVERRGGEFVRCHGQRPSYRDALVDALGLEAR